MRGYPSPRAMADPLSPADLPASASPGPSVDPPLARLEPVRTPAFAGVSRRLLAATLLVAIIVSGAVWLDDRRARQELRGEVARRLGEISSATQAEAKSQAQLASDLRDAQA